jgi:hypothetical protein
MKDMLVDIWLRNTAFTQFALKHNPREAELSWEVQMIRNIVAMYRELGEFTDEIPWKWWGRGVWKLDRKKAAMELIDLLHFLFIAFQRLGYNAKDIYRLYCEKNNENWSRFIKKIGWGKVIH